MRLRQSFPKPLPIAFILLLLSILLVACEDMFTTTVEVDLSDMDKKLVLNCLFNDTSNFAIQVFKNTDILDETAYAFVENASVELYANNQLLEIVPFNTLPFTIPYTTGPITFFNSETMAVANTQYTLKVHAPNFNSVQATASLPNKMPHTQVHIDSLFEANGNYDITQIKLHFTELNTNNNYYYIIAYRDRHIKQTAILDTIQKIRSYYQNPDTLSDLYQSVLNKDSIMFKSKRIYSSDVSLQTEATQSQVIDLDNPYNMPAYKGFALFSNTLFKGQEKELTILLKENKFASNYFPDLVAQRHIIAYGTASEDFVKYYQTTQLQADAIANTFAEPVQVYNNITNGLGIFAGYTVQVVVLE